jgi:hypothetical protein
MTALVHWRRMLWIPLKSAAVDPNEARGGSLLQRRLACLRLADLTELDRTGAIYPLS